MNLFFKYQKQHLKFLMKKYGYTFLSALLLMNLSCQIGHEQRKFNNIFSSYLAYYLENDRSFASLNVYDQNLSDISEAAFQENIHYIERYLTMFTEFDTTHFSFKLKTNFLLLKRHLNQRLFNLKIRQIWKNSPDFYLELLGNYFYWPLQAASLYPKDVFEILAGRLKSLPFFLEQAKQNLTLMNPLSAEIARGQTSGLIHYFKNDLTQYAKNLPQFSDSLKAALEAGVVQLTQWDDFLEKQLGLASTFELYFDDRTFNHILKIHLGEQVDTSFLLELTNDELKKSQQGLIKSAQEISQKYYPQRSYPIDSLLYNEKILQDALNFVQDQRLEPANFLPYLQEIMRESERFLKFKDLLTIIKNIKLEFSEAPLFYRHQFIQVTGLNQPDNKKFHFSVNLPAPDWRWPQVLDYTQYFNQNRLKVVALSHLIPGKYLQFNIVDSLNEPVQQYFGDHALREGWALYAPYFMRSAGFTGYDPAFILMQELDLYQSTLTAHLCIRTHLERLTKQEVSAILIREGFFEPFLIDNYWYQICLHPEEIIAKFWGFYQIRDLYHTIRLQKRNRFNLKAFNETLLDFGLIPIQRIRSRLVRAS